MAVGAGVVGVGVGVSWQVQVGDGGGGGGVVVQLQVGVSVGEAVSVELDVDVDGLCGDVDASAECEASRTVKLVAASNVLAAAAILARLVIFNVVASWGCGKSDASRNAIERQTWGEMNRFVVMGP